MLTSDREFIFDMCEEVLRGESETVKKCTDAMKCFMACLSSDQVKEYIRLESEQVKTFNLLIEKIYLKGKSDGKN